MLIIGGVVGKIASERMGHSTISITQDLYSHVSPHDQDLAAELVDRKLRPYLPKTPSRN